MTVFRRLPGPMRRGLVHSVTPSYTVGAVAVLRRSDGRIALVEQRHSLGWALPGGLMNRGESPSAALVREIAEEVGITLDPLQLPVPHAAVSPLVRRVDVVYFVDVDGESPLRSEDEIEVTRTGWFPLDALPELSEPTYDILRAVRVL
jgi:ADP-ribose pyrophosphatase YjhB (NUDIX family)